MSMLALSLKTAYSSFMDTPTDVSFLRWRFWRGSVLGVLVFLFLALVISFPDFLNLLGRALYRKDALTEMFLWGIAAFGLVLLTLPLLWTPSRIVAIAAPFVFGLISLNFDSVSHFLRVIFIIPLLSALLGFLSLYVLRRLIPETFWTGCIQGFLLGVTMFVAFWVGLLSMWLIVGD